MKISLFFLSYAESKYKKILLPGDIHAGRRQRETRVTAQKHPDPLAVPYSLGS
jgi:hypothetical protein